MPALAESQQHFGQALVAGAPDAFFEAFIETPALARRRFEAYRRNVLGNWRAALASTYPVLCQLVGPVRFRAIADAYVAAHGSVDGDLNAYGGALPIFLQVAPQKNSGFLPASGAALEPYLPDVARLEWALQCAYVAADPPAFDLAPLAAIPPEQQDDVLFQLWSGARLLESQWPVAKIWQAHQIADADVRDAALADIDLTPRYFASLATRNHAGEVMVLDCSPGEAALWQAMTEGVPLGTGIGRALAVEPTCAVDRLLPRWFQNCLIVGYSLAVAPDSEATVQP